MRTKRSRSLQVEFLESREVLSTFYVAPTGDDGDAGSDQAPWRTLQHAADTVEAGDIVIVRAGTYAGFDLWTDGTASAPIAFRADSGVVIDEPNQRTPDGINLEGADYITIEGFEVIGLPRTGIRSVLNHHVTIRNNRLDANGKWGILTGFSDDLLIENNVASRSVDEHGIYVSNSGDRPVIRGNVVWGNHGNGIHMNGDLSEGGDGLITEALVERNTIYDNGLGGGSGINCDGVQSSRFQNNLLYNNHASGISLYRIDGAAGSKNNVVVNNTIVQASNGRWCLNIQNGSTGNTVYNNILYNYHSFRGSIDISPNSLTGFTSDYNAVMERFTTDGGDSILDLSEWQSATGQDQHSLVATPSQLFVDAAGNDYHLSATSPALDAGTSQQAPTVDLEGTARPQGPAWDIGSDERVAGNPLPSLSIDDVSAVERHSRSHLITFTVTLSAASSQTVTVSYATANGTATAGSDYKAKSGTVTFNPGQTSKTIAIRVYGDRTVEPDETFFVNLSNATGATLADAQGDGTIVNDDGSAGGRAASTGLPAPPLLLAHLLRKPSNPLPVVEVSLDHLR